MKPHPDALKEGEVFLMDDGEPCFTDLGRVVCYYRRHAEGWSVRQLAAFYGVTESSVYWSLGPSCSNRKYVMKDGETTVDWFAK